MREDKTELEIARVKIALLEQKLRNPQQIDVFKALLKDPDKRERELGQMDEFLKKLDDEERGEDKAYFLAEFIVEIQMAMNNAWRKHHGHGLPSVSDSKERINRRKRFAEIVSEVSPKEKKLIEELRKVSKRD